VTENQRPQLPERIGRYRVTDRIGRGAMGVVYAAHDERMGRDVAIKVMMTDLEAEPDIRARFMREAQVSATLAHRNIVTIFDIGEDNGRLFIVMELLRGQTLDKCLKQRTLSIEEKVELTLEICEGLAVASQAGVCHRDIKPGNLFLQADGPVKILDFGIARLASSSMTASGFIVGTPDYMSPEQARGVEIDERSDIFSVGAVLYFMLAGRKPFAAPDLPAVLHKVMSEDPPALDPVAAPAGVARIVLKALAKNPSDRFQRFPDFAADLRRWKRKYDGETRALAGDVARTLGLLSGVATEERKAADALGISPESDYDAWVSEIGVGYPQLQTGGADVLRSGQWRRGDVEEISRRIGSITAACQPRIAALHAAGSDLASATRELEEGNARAALTRFESILRQVPSARIQPLLDRARQIAAEQQAREDKLRSLLAEATTARDSGRLDAAHALVSQALSVQPQSLEARQLLSAVQQDLATIEAEKAHQCERCLERARRALQLEEIEEAEHQLQLAVETGAANAEISVVRLALTEARAARDLAGALTQEIASELAHARAEFLEGSRSAAIARLQALASKHPSSLASQAELTRLRAEDTRLAAMEQNVIDAERLAADAAAALTGRDVEGAMRLADEALALAPGHELALRTSVMAHAQQREMVERSAREERARLLIESAKAHLTRGRFDSAIREARQAAELDPTGTEAPAVIADAYHRQADAKAAEVKAKEAAQRTTGMRELLETAVRLLRMKDFTGARAEAEKALALDPDSSGPKEMIAKIATAAAVAATPLEDDTVDFRKDEVDPDRTAVLAPVSEGWMRRLAAAVRFGVGRLWTSVARVPPPWDARAQKDADAEPAPGGDPDHKEA
jgi:serine/threonine-protein kinase